MAPYFLAFVLECKSVNCVRLGFLPRVSNVTVSLAVMDKQTHRHLHGKSREGRVPGLVIQEIAGGLGIVISAPNISLSSLRNEQDQRNTPPPILPASTVMHNRMCFLVSINLKNHFTNIEIIRDPSTSRRVASPSVPMETRSLARSRVVMHGLRPGWPSPVGEPVASAVSCNVFSTLRPTLAVGSLGSVLFSGVIPFNFSKGILPMSGEG